MTRGSGSFQTHVKRHEIQSDIMKLREETHSLSSLPFILSRSAEEWVRRDSVSVCLWPRDKKHPSISWPKFIFIVLNKTEHLATHLCKLIPSFLLFPLHIIPVWAAETQESKLEASENSSPFLPLTFTFIQRVFMGVLIKSGEGNSRWKLNTFFRLQSAWVHGRGKRNFREKKWTVQLRKGNSRARVAAGERTRRFSDSSAPFNHFLFQTHNPRRFEQRRDS